MRLGPLEIVILLVIVILIFGPGRIKKTLGELGGGIKSFLDGIRGKKDDQDPDGPEQK